MHGTPLSGLRVLSTRPAERGGQTSGRLARLGATTLHWPALVLEGVAPPPAERDAIAGAALLVFPSVTAVEAALACGVELRGRPAAAVGRATAARLQAAGAAPVHAPTTGGGSEDLLALAALGTEAVAGLPVVLLRGEGGRTLIAETLRARGASLREVALYRRTPNPAPLAPLLASGPPDVGLLTSAESAAAVAEAVRREALGELGRLPWVVGAPRIALAVRELGLGPVVGVAESPEEEALVLALLRWASAASPGGRPGAG